MLQLGNHAVPAFHLRGSFYVEKCATFHALDKLHVIRSSSFRIVDQLLVGRGLTPMQHFLPKFADGGGGGEGRSDADSHSEGDGREVDGREVDGHSGSEDARGRKTWRLRTRRDHIR